MRKLILLLMVLFVAKFSAQTTCQTAQPFCAGGTSGVTFPATVNGPAAQTGPNYGCLGSQPNPAWYFLQIGTSGNLDILIQGQIGSGPGQDVDFIAWGPFSSLANVCSSLTAGNTIDCSYSSSFTETLNIVGGVAGQYYMVLITNFANVAQNIVFTQYSGNGSTNCALVANNQQICAGNTATIIANNSTNLSSPSYSLNPGALTSPNPTFVVSPTSTTQYTVYVTGVNSLSQVQTVSATANVTVNPQPSVSPTATQASCSSATNAVNLGLTWSPSAPTGYTVTWSPTPGSVTSNTQTSATNVGSGTTNVTVTAAGGCSTTSSFTMAPIPGPVSFTISPAGGVYSITCATPSVVLTAAPSNYTYSWVSITNPSLTGTSAVFTNTNQGSYTVTATDPATGCISTQTFAIGQNTTAPTSTVNPVSQVITCASSAATFTGTALSPTVNIQHEWYCPQNPPPTGPPAFTSNNVQSPFSTICGPGTYTYIVRDLTNGCIVTKTVSLSSASGFPSFNTASTTNYSVGCIPANQTTLSIINAVSVNSAAVQFLFLPPGTPSAVPIPTAAFGALSSTVTAVPGAWTFVVNDPSNSCQTAIPVNILQNTIAPHVDASLLTQTLTCTNPTVLATGTSTTPNTQVVWNMPSTPPTSSTNTIIVGPGTGPNTSTTSLTYASYTVAATNTVNSCKTTSVVVINQNFRAPLPLISVGNPSVINCNGICANLSFTNAAVTSSVPGAFAIVTAWEGPAPQASVASVAQYSACVAGVYTLTVKDSYNGCLGSKTFTVLDRTQPPVLTTPVANATLDCGSNKASLSPLVVGGNSNHMFLFKNYPLGASFTPSTAIIPPGSSASTYSVSMNGVYEYVVTNTVTGCRATGTFVVNGGDLIADFTPDATSGYSPLLVNFVNTSSSSLGTGSITSVWSFGNGTSQTTTLNVSTAATYTAPGTYTVLLIASKGACLDTALKVIKVEIPSKLEIPNVFTPNGDGSNDVFFLKTSNLTEISTWIYDRWGNKVYEVTSTTGNIAWDGKNLEGKECPSGTYFYIIKATGKDSKTYEQKGNVSLFR